MEGCEAKKIQADLRTAQNRMFPFVAKAIEDAENSGKIAELMSNPEDVTKLYDEVHQQILVLLSIPKSKKAIWHMGIIDSGKRAIEAIVSYFCPKEQGANILVNTENYVAFNKFSAASALRQQKKIEFLQPFNLKMGQALTIDSAEEMAKAKILLRGTAVRTLWLAWNSTSTGIRERIEEIVEYRNTCNSKAIIICDAASLPLFTRDWRKIKGDHLPDVFFFSLRKQGLPYEGPQDEAHQARNSGCLYLFNDRALQQAKSINGVSLYDTPKPQQAANNMITSGEQRENHIRHLLKLQKSVSVFLAKGSKHLLQCDKTRRLIGEEVRRAFASDGILSQKGFKLLPHAGVQSENAYIVKVPDNIRPHNLINNLKKQGILVSLSMHPSLPKNDYLRFACYPANSLKEARTTLNGLIDCLSE